MGTTLKCNSRVFNIKFFGSKNMLHIHHNNILQPTWNCCSFWASCWEWPSIYQPFRCFPQPHSLPRLYEDTLIAKQLDLVCSAVQLHRKHRDAEDRNVPRLSHCPGGKGAMESFQRNLGFFHDFSRSCGDTLRKPLGFRFRIKLRMGGMGIRYQVSWSVEV